MQYDVFISYSRKDIAAAETLCRALDEAGVNYWIDRNMHGSVNFLSEITRYIRNAQAVLFIASDNSAKSEWTQKEILYALKHKKTIIPYRLGKFHFEQNEELDFVFTNVHWIDSLEAVVDTLQKLGLTHQKRVVPPTPPTPPQPTEPRRLKWLWALALMPLLLIGLWFGFVQEENTNIIDDGKGRNGVYQVGDYYDDGTKQGVVFEVDESGRHGKIVGLNEVKLQWCTDDALVLTGAKDKDNGRNNQVCIQQIADWRTKYPAFAWCADQGKGWYLPSLNEVKTIYRVKDKVNRTLEKMSSDKIQIYWYLSSTEKDEFCAWGVGMDGGYTSSYGKYGNGYVRAVSAF
ncbi:MAG: TIR domain-containing protein [Alistipes sp.]|nr:TIR domain-containing protein [Alistipes sp.]